MEKASEHLDDLYLRGAINVAVKAHAGQHDKRGHPYILHPLRVMCKMPLGKTAHQIVAVLHDVIEDNPEYTLDQFRFNGFDARIVDALDAITQRKDETYWAYIDRCSLNQVALFVKLADLADNMSRKRRYLGDESMRKRYEQAIDILEERWDGTV